MRSRSGERCRPMRTPLRSRGRRSTPRDIAPMVTWGTNPEQTLPITGRCPIPQTRRAERRRDTSGARLYGPQPGMPLTEIAVDRVFIGSCTNGGSRICAPPPRGRGSGARRSRMGGAGLRAGQAPGRSRRARPNIHRCRIRMARAGCSLCTAHQRRLAARRGALRVDLEPQLPRPPGPGGRTHLDESGDGGGGGNDRPAYGCSRTAAGGSNMEPFTPLTAVARPDRRDQRRHQPDRVRRASTRCRAGRNTAQLLFHDRRFDADGTREAISFSTASRIGGRRIVVADRNAAAAPRAKARSTRSTTSASAA